MDWIWGGEKEHKNDSTGLGLTDWKNGVAIQRDGKDGGRKKGGGKLGA